MSKSYLTPIDMNSLEIENFLVDNKSELPTALPGRLVYHDSSLKYGRTSGDATTWVTLLDSANHDVNAYKSWTETQTYLNANYYTKSEMTTYLSSKADASHSHTAAQISDWQSAWESTFSSSAKVTERLSAFLDGDVTDLCRQYEDHNQRLYLDVTKVSVPLSSVQTTGTSSTSGSYCWSTACNKLLYLVGGKYYATGGHDILGVVDGTKSRIAGDIVAFNATTNTPFEAWVYDGTEYHKLTCSNDISSLQESIDDHESRVADMESWKAETATTLEILTGASDTDGAINKWNEVTAFLEGFSDSEAESLKEQLDAKAGKGPLNMTATTSTPTLSGLTLSAKTLKTYRRLTINTDGNLASEAYKYVLDITVGTNTATVLQITNLPQLVTNSAILQGFYGEFTIQVFKVSTAGVYDEVMLDVSSQSAGIVLTWATAPQSGEQYRVIVVR